MLKYLHWLRSKYVQLTATILGVCRWMIHLMSGLAWWMAEWSMKPAWFTPKFVVPSSTCSPWNMCRCVDFGRILDTDYIPACSLWSNLKQSPRCTSFRKGSTENVQYLDSLLPGNNILKDLTKKFHYLNVPWHGCRFPGSSRTARSACRRPPACTVTLSLPWRRPWSRYRGCHWSGPRSERRAQSL